MPPATLNRYEILTGKIERDIGVELSPSKNLRISWLVLGAVLVTIPLSLNDTFSSMIQKWITSSNFTHCFLIIPASAYLIWDRRERLAKLQPAASMAGVVLVIAAGLLWVLGSLANAAIIENLAAVAFIPLSVWTVLGRRVASEIAFPLLYLFFMVPFGEFLIPRLMDFTADFTVAAVRLSGVPIYRDGLFLTIPNGSFKVVDACSGVRMLIASVAVGALFAHVAFRSWNRRIWFLLAAVFLAMVTNGLRAYTVVMIGHLIGMEAANRHVLLGYVFFGVLIIVLLVVGSRFSDQDPGDSVPVHHDTSERLPSRLRGFLSAGMVIAVVIMTPITAAALHASILRDVPPEPLQLPLGGGQWAKSAEAKVNWEPDFTGRHSMDFGQYASESAVVDVYTISYGQQTPDSELISSANLMFDPGTWIQVRENLASTDLPSGQQWNYIELELLAGTSKRLIRYWYTVNDAPSSSDIQVKLMELQNAIQGHTSSSSVTAISTEFFDDLDVASTALDEFFTSVLADSYRSSD